MNTDIQFFEYLIVFIFISIFFFFQFFLSDRCAKLLSLKTMTLRCEMTQWLEIQAQRKRSLQMYITEY